MPAREFPAAFIAWTESVWREAGVEATEEQTREMAYVAARTILQSLLLPYAEKNGGTPLVSRYAHALATMPGWEPPDRDAFLDHYDDVVTHFINIVEPATNTGSARTDRHRDIDAILAEGTADYRAPLSGGTCAELLIDGGLAILRPTWVEDLRNRFGAASEPA
jgi:hypothetical protein